MQCLICYWSYSYSLMLAVEIVSLGLEYVDLWFCVLGLEILALRSKYKSMTLCGIFDSFFLAGSAFLFIFVLFCNLLHLT